MVIENGPGTNQSDFGGDPVYDPDAGFVILDPDPGIPLTIFG